MKITINRNKLIAAIRKRQVVEGKEAEKAIAAYPALLQAFKNSALAKLAKTSAAVRAAKTGKELNELLDRYHGLRFEDAPSLASRTKKDYDMLVKKLELADSDTLVLNENDDYLSYI